MNQTHSAVTPQTISASPTQRSHKVTRADLPLHCPMPGTTLWDSHPRVFLSLAAAGRTRCPYCGTEYIFED